MNGGPGYVTAQHSFLWRYWEKLNSRLGTGDYTRAVIHIGIKYNYACTRRPECNILNVP
jgi:hypothetical protein